MEICRRVPLDTHIAWINLEQAFVDCASLRTDKAGGKWFTFKPEQNNLGDTYNPSWKSHSNLSQSNLEGLVSNFMASQDARLSKFEADFKLQQSEMTNKIDTVLKAITDRITGALPSDTVKNPKLNINLISPVLSARSYPTEDPQCSSHPVNSINAIKTYGIKSYHIRIVRDVEVHIGKLKLLNDFYVIDIKNDPETPLLVGRGFLATTNAVIDCRKTKISVEEGITRLIDPDGEEFTKTFQSIPNSRKLSEEENPKRDHRLGSFP
ncbi:MAK10-like protein [Tanacetum coccineum]